MKRKEVRQLEELRLDVLKVKRLLLQEVRRELEKELLDDDLPRDEKEQLVQELRVLKLGL